MHEMALCESILEILSGEAEKQGFASVKMVRLEIGMLSNVEPEAMRFCFDAVVRGTLADGASLEILRPPGEAWCMDCQLKVPVAQRYDPCPQCGGHMLQITGGEDMRIKDLEVA